jgi:hypothetical protein
LGVATDAPSLSVTAGVAAARVRQLKVLRDPSVATDLSAELGEAAFKQHGVGASAV